MKVGIILEQVIVQIIIGARAKHGIIQGKFSHKQIHIHSLWPCINSIKHLFRLGINSAFYISLRGED